PPGRRLGEGEAVGGEDEEGGWNRVPRARLITQHAAAALQHHWAMADGQRVKGGLVPLAIEALEQVAVGHLPHTLVDGDPPDQVQDRAGHGLGHRGVPNERKWLYYIVPSDATRGRIISKVRGSRVARTGTR